MSNTLSSCRVPVKVEVLFISMHQLHLGLLQGPQLLFPFNKYLVGKTVTFKEHSSLKSDNS